MKLFSLPRAIRRAAVIYPDCPLTEWYSAQNEKPDILLNGSLYHDSDNPIGTVIRGGKLIHNAGNGIGVGVKDNVLSFGDPWRNWDDYLTAYYAVVQLGKAVDPPWNDKSVFERASSRLAIGQLAGGNIALLSDDGVSIRTFAARAVEQGFELLCNLDGGASRALLWLGSWIYTSERTPFNAIAIWLEPLPESPRISMTRYASSVIRPCGSDGRQEYGRRIDPGDKCILQYGRVPIPVRYPVTGGSRDAYVPGMTGMVSLYNQHDYPDVPYPAPGYENATIKSGGCGPTAAAIVVETLTAWQSFNPPDAASFAMETGARVSGGTDMRTFSLRIAEKFHLHVAMTSELSELRSHLARGGIAIANVAGHKDIFSTSGHYLVVLGETDGQLAIADPGYYSGKYGIRFPSRQKEVTVKGKGTKVILLSSPQVLDADCERRSPRYYLFRR